LTTIPSIAQKRAFWNLLLKLIKDNQLTMKTFVPLKANEKERGIEGEGRKRKKKKRKAESHMSH